MGIGLNSAMNTASMGIKASEKMINVIGNNLSNANTVGFKAERANFADMLSYTYKLGQEPGATSGGGDPLQIGMGVVLSSVSTNFNQGTVKDGMTKTDMAIQGGGFFVLRADPNEPGQYYTRNGVMKLDANEDLTNSEGMYVMGYTIDQDFQLQTDHLSKLRIPVGEMKIAEATELVSLNGMLNAIGPDSTQGTIIQSSPFADLSKQSPGTQVPSTSQSLRPSVENSSTTAVGTIGTGNVEPGDYVYRFAYARNGGVLGDETDYSSPIAASVEGGENSLTLGKLPIEQVPTGASPAYTDLRIYRAAISTDGTAGEFYRLDDIPLSSITDPATFTYTDVKSTATITDPAKKLNTDRVNGSYQYCVTFTNSLGGESRPSSIGGSITVNNGQVMISNVPVVDPASNPDGWTGRNVYRSGPDGKFNLVSSIPNMDPAVTVIDNTPDSKLASRTPLSEAGRGNALPSDSTKLLSLGKQLDDGTFAPAFESGTLAMTGIKGDTTLKTQTMRITADTTVGDYLKFLDQSFGIQSGGDIPLDQGTLGQSQFDGVQGARMIDGKISLLGNSGIGNSLQIKNQTITDTSGKVSNIDMEFDESQAADGESLSTYLTVYDSLGAEVNVRLNLAIESKTDNATTYRWYADSSDNQPLTGNEIAVGSGTMTFDSHGKLIDTSTTKISILRTEVASVSPTVFEFDMDLSSVAALATSNANLSQTDQDGAAAGILSDYSIGLDGVITGIFDTGATRTLGQVLLANFANQDGLTKVGDNLFATSANSGPAVIDVPNQGGYGKIKANSIEMSNTDIGSELIDMILASAMYRANTKVITTANEMFDTLIRAT